MRNIHGENIYGIDVDERTRCFHYKTDLDIIAIKFRCCGKWFPCYECHAAISDHDPQVWPAEEFDANAVLCGECGLRLSINEYFECGSACPQCESRFNPNCASHYHLYFQQDM